jgi:hypothetical protein
MSSGSFRTRLQLSHKAGHYIERVIGNPVFLTKQDPLMHQILIYLKQSPRKNDKKLLETQVVFPYAIEVRLTEDLFLRNGHTFTMTAMSYIDNLIRKKINEELFLSIDVSVNAAIEERRSILKRAIEAYCDVRDLDPDIFKYDSLKRAYLRFRNERKVVKKSNNSLAILSP